MLLRSWRSVCLVGGSVGRRSYTAFDNCADVGVMVGSLRMFGRRTCVVADPSAPLD